MTPTTKLRTRTAALVAAGAMGLGTLAIMTPASAGIVWEGEVTVEPGCDEGRGLVYVDIFDEFSATYDVALLLGSDVIDLVEGINDTDDGAETVEFPTEPGASLEDGTYTVIVDWIREESEVGFVQVFEGDVTVDCVPDDTTTTTAAVSPSSTTPPPAAAAAPATPRFTG